MATKIYINGGAINIDDGVNALVVINPRQFDWKPSGANYEVRDKIDNQSYSLGILSNVQKEDGSGFATAALLITYLNALMKGVADVALQDQHTRSVIVKFNKVTNNTETVGAVAIDDTSVTLDVVTGVAVGSYLIFFHPASARFMVATVTSIASTPSFDIDTPFDFAFPDGTFCDVAITNMNVKGDVTPQIFGLRGTGAPPGVALTLDVTKIIISCIATSIVDLSKFANFLKLTNGLVMRKRDGEYENVFNVKSNREIAGIMFLEATAATNPQQGVDGFVGRLTFAGQNEIGVVKRIALGEDLEIIIQDDLETAQSTETITELEVIAEGHIVLD